MPAKRKKESVAEAYFVWLLGQRDGIYYADGRSNKQNAGRHSLGASQYSDARKALKQLDLVKAVEFGLADESVLMTQSPTVDLAAGRKLYETHVARPRVVGGARPSSTKRYRAVFDKFDAFARKRGIDSWNGVNRQVLVDYAKNLERLGYAYASEYLELTTLKQTIKWLVQEKHLPNACLVHLPLPKASGTSTYCWRSQEVQAIVAFCHDAVELHWLGNVLVALACTGLRISELASLRWTDIDLEKNFLELTDDSRQGRANGVPARHTKNGRSRSFPISVELREVLRGISRTQDGVVFHGPRGGRLKPDTVRQVLVRDVLTPLKERFPTPTGEIGFLHGRLHSFRHYFCSTCSNSGVPEKVVMAWLGHRDSAMVARYYHLHDKEAQRQMKNLVFVGSPEANGASGKVQLTQRGGVEADDLKLESSREQDSAAGGRNAD